MSNRSITFTYPTILIPKGLVGLALVLGTQMKLLHGSQIVLESQTV